MQDLDNDPPVEPRRLSAVPLAAGPARQTAGESVVPAPRLLEAAGALSDGAMKLHAQLSHLEAPERDAVLELLEDQMGEIVRLWMDLVRGVVPATVPSSSAARSASEVAGSARTGHGAASISAHRRSRVGSNHPARLPISVAARDTTPPPPSLRHDLSESGRDPERNSRDELTGVLNRQAGLAAFERELERCRRAGDGFVLGYLNVDGMTAINETRGVRSGDEVLRKVTAALRATLRSYDVIARLGGDEFLFSVPGADLSTAEHRFKEFSVILAEEVPNGSASVGFAQLHEGDTLDDVIVTAETAMLKGRRMRRRGRG
jgi:diguanylate cyclase (GGDEF)-like protein